MAAVEGNESDDVYRTGILREADRESWKRKNLNIVASERLNALRDSPV